MMDKLIRQENGDLSLEVYSSTPGGLPQEVYLPVSDRDSEAEIWFWVGFMLCDTIGGINKTDSGAFIDIKDCRWEDHQ